MRFLTGFAAFHFRGFICQADWFSWWVMRLHFKICDFSAKLLPCSSFSVLWLVVLGPFLFFLLLRLFYWQRSGSASPRRGFTVPISTYRIPAPKSESLLLGRISRVSSRFSTHQFNSPLTLDKRLNLPRLLFPHPQNEDDGRNPTSQSFFVGEISYSASCI